MSAPSAPSIPQRSEYFAHPGSTVEGLAEVLCAGFGREQRCRNQRPDAPVAVSRPSAAGGPSLPGRGCLSDRSDLACRGPYFPKEKEKGETSCTDSLSFYPSWVLRPARTRRRWLSPPPTPHRSPKNKSAFRRRRRSCSSWSRLLHSTRTHWSVRSSRLRPIQPKFRKRKDGCSSIRILREMISPRKWISNPGIPAS